MFTYISNLFRPSNEVQYQPLPSYSQEEVYKAIRKAEDTGSLSEVHEIYHKKTGDKKLDALVKVYFEGKKEKNPDSMLCLGVHYQKGKNPLNKDVSRAMYYVSKSAYRGHVEAMKLLGDYYRVGFGCRPSEKQTKLWYRLAEENSQSYSRSKYGAVRSIRVSDFIP